MNDSVVIVRIDKPMKDRLQKMAEKDGRTVSSFIRFILKKVVSGEIKL
jgi:antitoxin component of RelBE/YafQ-DinJ toxin-antitoxin module